MEPPETKFAKLGDEHIAYQVLGKGPPDILYASGSGSHVDVALEYPRFQYLIRRLSSMGRLIRYDRRGAGASDPLPHHLLPSWEVGIDDIKAVLDEVQAERVTIIAILDSAPVALLFAATYPERTSRLILCNTSARLKPDTDYPSGMSPEMAEFILEQVRLEWGKESFAELTAPSLAGDKAFPRWYAKMMRAAASPRTVAENLRQSLEMDARGILPSVQVPTLVMHSRGNRIVPLEQARYLADHLPHAALVELPGSDQLLFGKDMELALNHIEEFVTGTPRGSDPDRVLSTVLFTDIVGSTDRLAEIGDKVWRHTLEAHDSLIASSVEAFQGRIADTTGDGVLALFDGPGRALRCAFTLRDQLAETGIDIRTGMHTGEVEIRPEGKVSGIAVHIAARVVAEAQAREVLVSRTVKDLVTGGRVVFEPRGTHSLKGVPEDWELFAAVDRA